MFGRFVNFFGVVVLECVFYGGYCGSSFEFGRCLRVIMLLIERKKKSNIYDESETCISTRGWKLDPLTREQC